MLSTKRQDEAWKTTFSLHFALLFKNCVVTASLIVTYKVLHFSVNFVDIFFISD